MLFHYGEKLGFSAPRISQTIPFFISFDILKTAKQRIPIAKKEISKPSKGKNVIAAALKPKADNNPIPQAAQPGAKIPKKIPAVPANPAVPEKFFNIVVL